MADTVAALRAAGCVFAEDEARLLIEAAASPRQLASMVERRVAGEPLEYILGWVEFCGLRVPVDPGVFVPRRRTETLVRIGAELAPPAPTIVDLGCGCGAIGLALRAATGPGELYAVDIDPVAVRCAERNLPAGRVFRGDLYDPLPRDLRGRVDLIAANVPYVPSDAFGLLPPEARDHEPRAALDGGADGLTIARRVIDGATDWLAPGGHLLLETGADQSAEAARAMKHSGLVSQIVQSEDWEATVVIGTR